MAQTRNSTNYQKALKLAKQVDESPLDLAQAIWTLHNREPSRISDLIAESGMSRRKAYYLISVRSRFPEPKFKRETLATVGWTKLAILAKDCPEGKEEWGIKLALKKEATAKALPAMLKEGKTAKRTRCVVLYLQPDQYDLFEVAALANGATRSGKGLAGKEEAIMEMVKLASG